MDQQTDSLSPATARLEEEITACHAAMMTLFKEAEKDGPYSAIEYFNSATRMLRAQTGALALLQRLKANCTPRNVMPPPARKLKTNRPGGCVEIWEDEMGPQSDDWIGQPGAATRLHP